MIGRLSALALAALLPFAGHAEPLGDCTGSPADAVLELPAGIADWGTLACTAHGHIIANDPRWVWHYFPSREAILVPSQLTGSEPLGNASYFTRIEYAPMPTADKRVQAAWVALFGEVPMKSAWAVNRLTVVNAVEQAVTLFFFNFQDQDKRWGIFCNADGTGCQASTKFLVLRRDSVEWRRSNGS